MEKSRVKELAVLAAKARLAGLKAVYDCQSGHLGGSFSAADVLTVLYQEVMRVDPKDPKNIGNIRAFLE